MGKETHLSNLQGRSILVVESFNVLQKNIGLLLLRNGINPVIDSFVPLHLRNYMERYGIEGAIIHPANPEIHEVDIKEVHSSGLPIVVLRGKTVRRQIAETYQRLEDHGLPLVEKDGEPREYLSAALSRLAEQFNR